MTREQKKQWAIRVGIGVAAAGVTALAMSKFGPSINIAGNRNKIVMGSLTYIEANRQGPPSWVVRCLETGDIFTSQRAAALALNINEQTISRQINGLIESANDFHFERICLAA